MKTRGADTGIWPVRGVADLRGPGRGGRGDPGPFPGRDGLPVLVLDATLRAARVSRRVVSQAVVVGVNADGRREVLRMDVGDREDGELWTSFLRTLKARGLGGVRLVVSDAHAGLKAAIGAVRLGSS